MITSGSFQQRSGTEQLFNVYIQKLCTLNTYSICTPKPRFWVFFLLHLHEPRLISETSLPQLSNFNLYGIHSLFIKAAKQSSLECLHLYPQEVYANAQDALEDYAFGSVIKIK